MTQLTWGAHAPLSFPEIGMEVTVPFNHVTLGNVLEIFVMIIGGVGFIFAMRGALESLAKRMSAVEQEMTKLTNILITLGKYEERFLRNEADIWDLKHGKGFVTELPSRQHPRQSADYLAGRGPRVLGDPNLPED